MPPAGARAARRHERVRGALAVVLSGLLALAASVFMLVGPKALPAGLEGLVRFAVPVAAAAGPLVARSHRRLAIALRSAATVGLVLWMLFIGGIFFMPAAVAMAVAAGLAASTGEERTRSSQQVTAARPRSGLIPTRRHSAWSARAGVVATATVLCVATVGYHTVHGYLGEVGAGGLLLWVLPGAAIYGFVQFRYSRDQPHARGLIVVAALLSTLMVVTAPFTFAYFAPVTVALWAAVAALSSTTPQLPQHQP